MQDKGEQYGIDVQLVGEAYTSKTCGSCNFIKSNLGGDMTFDCDRCGISIHRQLNSPRNIFMKHITRFL